MKPLDDDVEESTKTAGWESGTDSDEHMAIHLRVFEGFDKLLPSEAPILHTSLVASHALNHKLLVFFGETLCSHGTVGHPKQDKKAPAHRNSAVGKKESLPVLDWRRWALDESEAVCQKSTNDLLTAVHHVPVRNCSRLFFPLV